MSTVEDPKENMVTYSYKDHEYRLTPMHFAACCWDFRKSKPTSFFWALLCIASFITYHWYMTKDALSSQQLQQMDNVMVQEPIAVNPKFKDMAHGDQMIGPALPNHHKQVVPTYKPEPKPDLDPAVRPNLEPEAIRPQLVPRPDLDHEAARPNLKHNIRNFPEVPEPDKAEKEVRRIIEENVKKGMPIQEPIFDRHPEERGHEVHPPEHVLHTIPKPKEFPVKILREPVLDCGPEGYLVVLLIEDNTDNIGGRLAIRNTWGIQDDVKFPTISPQTWKTIFVMGNLRGQNADFFNNAVRKESEKYGDILQADFEDMVHESTRKFMLGLKWLYESRGKCPTRFILKSRHDIFINMNSITEWLPERWGPNDRLLYIGKLLKDDLPIRKQDNPLYVSRTDYSHEFFPNMIEGPVYLFDWLAFEKLYLHMAVVTPIAMEDGYIGVLANQAGLKPINNNHFLLLSRPTDVCAHLKIFFIAKLLPKHHIELFTSNKNSRVKNLCPGARIIYDHKGGKPVPEHFEV